MKENETVKNEVRTGAEAEEKNKTSNSKKTTQNNGEKTASKTKGKTFEENIIRDSETAKERGRNGGIKSGEVRRANKDARETIQYMLGRMTKDMNIKDNLAKLGFESTEFSNMAALHGKLFAMAMSGNLEAYIMLMRMGGYEPEEIRKERESIAADRRREAELDAKIEALVSKGENASVSLNLDDEDGNNDVVIYLPQIASEESCEMEEQDEE